MLNNYGGGASGGTSKSGLSEQASQNIAQVSKEGSKVACECNHGLMIETLKKFMFKQN
jgi:hypothetical protein